jgi:hypothetical protein
LGTTTNGFLTLTNNQARQNGSLFATYTGGTTGLAAMQFTFNNSASQANIQTLLTNLTFSVFRIREGTNQPEGVDSGITNFTRVVQFDFSDGAGLTSAPVRLTVILNHAPNANLDRTSTGTNLPAVVAFAYLLKNDSDRDGDPITVAQLDAASQQGGTVVSNATGFVYTPPAGFVGLDRLTYTLTDGRTGISTGTVQIQVMIPGQLSIDEAPQDWGLMNNPADVGAMGISGQSYRLLGTEDFAAWTVLQTNIAPQAGFMRFFDQDATNHAHRFYRTVTP